MNNELMLTVDDSSNGIYETNIDDIADAVMEMVEVNDRDFCDNPDGARKYRTEMNANAKLLHSQRMKLTKEHDKIDDFAKVMAEMLRLEKVLLTEVDKVKPVIAADDARAIRRRDTVLKAMYENNEVPYIDFDDVKKAIGDAWYREDADDNKIEAQIAEYAAKLQKQAVEWNVVIESLPRKITAVRKAITTAGANVISVAPVL